MPDKSLFVAFPVIRRNSRLRHATTLVELLVVTTLVSILLLVVASSAIHFRQWDRQVRNHVQHGNQLVNLAETIRTDVRRAKSVTLPAQNIVAIADTGGGEIRYELQLESCRRVSKSTGQTSPGIESFAIGPYDAWKLEAVAPGRRPAYTISLERLESDKTTSQSAPFFVYAALGIDRP